MSDIKYNFKAGQQITFDITDRAGRVKTTANGTITKVTPTSFTMQPNAPVSGALNITNVRPQGA